MEEERVSYILKSWLHVTIMLSKEIFFELIHAPHVNKKEKKMYAFRVQVIACSRYETLR